MHESTAIMLRIVGKLQSGHGRRPVPIRSEILNFPAGCEMDWSRTSPSVRGLDLFGHDRIRIKMELMQFVAQKNRGGLPNKCRREGRWFRYCWRPELAPVDVVPDCAEPNWTKTLSSQNSYSGISFNHPAFNLTPNYFQRKPGTYQRT